MADSGFQALEVDPETFSGGAIPFQFEVSWRSLTEPEIEPRETTSDNGTNPPETEAAFESEPIKPLFSDYVSSLTSAGLSLWGQIRPRVRWMALAAMGLAIVAFALSTRGGPIAKSSSVEWTARTLPDGSLQLRFDRNQPSFQQSLDTLRSLPNKRLEMIFSPKLKSLNGFESLRELKNLTSLNLSGANVSDLSALRGLKSLTSLNLSGTKVADVSALRDLKTLTSLNLFATEVADLSPLRELTHLTSLDLFDTEVTDISPLRKLTSLSFLNLSGTKVANVSALRELKALTSLGLYGAKVTDVSPLRELKSLTSLDLFATAVTDISPLRELKNLTTLNLSHTNVADLSPLRDLKNLASVNLSGAKITSQSIISELRRRGVRIQQ
jgi:Leucine-rich repeat (LRR) protein